MEINEKIIADVVRKVIAEQFGNDQKEKFEKTVDRESGVAVIKTATVKPEKFDTGKEGDKVYLLDTLSLKESPRVGTGVMEMEASCFDWTLKYDEVDYIIDGILEIIIDGRKIIGHKGDVIFIPKNTTIQFNAPDFVRFMYVVYPANWFDQ